MILEYLVKEAVVELVPVLLSKTHVASDYES
jgi:hypothetical protein